MSLSSHKKILNKPLSSCSSLEDCEVAVVTPKNGLQYTYPPRMDSVTSRVSRSADGRNYSYIDLPQIDLTVGDTSK